MEIITTVTDELYAELEKLTEQKVVSFSIWDESLADALAGETDENGKIEGPIANSSNLDIDLYLQDGVYFELYSAVCFPDLYSEPLNQAEEIESVLSSEIRSGLWLDEVAVDEDNQLVLVLSRNHQTVLFLVVGGWAVDGWDELPDQ